MCSWGVLSGSRAWTIILYARGLETGGQMEWLKLNWTFWAVTFWCASSAPSKCGLKGNFAYEYLSPEVQLGRSYDGCNHLRWDWLAKRFFSPDFMCWWRTLVPSHRSWVQPFRHANASVSIWNYYTGRSDFYGLVYRTLAICAIRSRVSALKPIEALINNGLSYSARAPNTPLIHIFCALSFGTCFPTIGVLSCS